MANKKISALTSSSTPLAGSEVLPIVQGGATVKVAVSDLTAGRAVSMLDMNATQNASVTGNLTVGPAAAVTAVTISGSTDQNATYGRLQAVYTGSSTSANSGITVKNYQGTGQFMQWDVYGMRIGSRIVTNTGQGQVIFTYANDSEACRLTTSGNLAFPSGQGIDFSATPGTGTSELFADYEEGTWTPAGVLSSPGSSATSNVVATYTKVGRLVTVACSFNFTLGTGSGNFSITGLPFTASSALVYTAFAQGCENIGASTKNIVGYINPSNTNFYLILQPQGTGASAQLTSGEMAATSTIRISASYAT